MKKLILLLTLIYFSTGYNLAETIEGKEIPQGKETSVSSGLISVDLTNSNIHISGSPYTTRKPDTIYFKRFSDKILSMPLTESKLNPVKAHTTSGIVILFKTKSPLIQLKFTVEEGENRGHKYAVYQDGTLCSEHAFSKTEGPDLIFDFSSTNPGKEVFYEITLPNWSITALSGLYIEQGHELLKIETDNKPVYVAYGNSITHGTGQNGTHKTYPFLLSDKLETELYNIAVGGSKTSGALAKMLRDDFPVIDLLTILIGYNDYNGEGISSQEYYNRYLNVLRTIREKHKNTQIFCITLTYTTNLNSVATGVPADEFRQVVIDIVDLLQQEGDENIFLVHGDSISTHEMLKDAVHLSETGALQFSDLLGEKIREITGPLAQDRHLENSDNSLIVKSGTNTNCIIVESQREIDTISLYNMKGEMILKQSYIAPRIDISAVSPGEYIISVDYKNKNIERDSKLFVRI